MSLQPIHTILPFSPDHLDFNYKSAAWLTLPVQSAYYNLATKYIAKNISIRDWKSSSFSINSDESPEDDSSHRICLNLGLGVFKFKDTEGLEMVALHQSIGKPVGTESSAEILQNLVLFALDGNEQRLCSFCANILKDSQKTEIGKFNIFSWNVQRSRWNKEKACKARPLESVILSREVKDKLLSDVSRFLEKETKTYYLKHGIPYRRTYLFYGVPGSGKTSLIQALAGHLQRNLCFVQPTHPLMTDTSLRSALTDAATKSIIVLEDIDALFTKDRKNKVDKSPLTFSGLLNALDGVGDSNGQIFILTTNLRWELDSALIRNGRVDVHIPFDYTTEEQMKDMWNSFYPSATDMAEEFAMKLKNILENKDISTAAIQHFFVCHMLNTPEEALEDVKSIMDSLNERGIDMVNENTQNTQESIDCNKNMIEKTKEDESNNSVKEEIGSSTSTSVVSKVIPPIHVHIHSENDA